MEVFMDIIIQYLAEFAALIVITLIGVFGSWLLNKMKQNKNLKNIALATEQVLNAAKQTVLELQQRFVEEWKSAQDGKLTSQQVDELRAKVIEITMAKLAEPTLNLLAAAKVDVLAMITSSAEAYVLELKKGGV